MEGYLVGLAPSYIVGTKEIMQERPEQQEVGLQGRRENDRLSKNQ